MFNIEHEVLGEGGGPAQNIRDKTGKKNLDKGKKWKCIKDKWEMTGYNRLKSEIESRIYQKWQDKGTGYVEKGKEYMEKGTEYK